MNKSIPILYTEYNRYITSSRAVPSNVDCLLPVERRVLYILWDDTHNSKRTVKSAKIVGRVIGEIHPHGDVAAYNTLVQLSKHGFVETQGNWGSRSLDDDGPAHYRYTEARINKWIEKYAFKYIKFSKFIPGELPNEIEPKYIPCPIPIGLIGYDVGLGISVYKGIWPKYAPEDLAKRLKWLLNKKSGDEPIIKPRATDCFVQGSDEDFKLLLTTGSGSLIYIPNGKIDNKEKAIYINGRAPQANFNSLKLAIDETEQKRLLNSKNSGRKRIKILSNKATIQCLSKDGINIRIIPYKKNTNLAELSKEIWLNYLNKTITFQIVTIDENKMCNPSTPVDDILLNNFIYYKETVLNFLISEFKKQVELYINNYCIFIIKNILNKYPNIKHRSELLDLFNKEKINPLKLIDYDIEKKIFFNLEYKISEEEIKKVYSNYSIVKLVEQEVDMNSHITEIQNSIKNIKNIDNICLSEIENIINNSTINNINLNINSNADINVDKQ